MTAQAGTTTAKPDGRILVTNQDPITEGDQIDAGENEFEQASGSQVEGTEEDLTEEEEAAGEEKGKQEDASKHQGSMGVGGDTGNHGVCEQVQELEHKQTTAVGNAEHCINIGVGEEGGQDQMQGVVVQTGDGPGLATVLPKEAAPPVEAVGDASPVVSSTAVSKELSRAVAATCQRQEPDTAAVAAVEADSVAGSVGLATLPVEVKMTADVTPTAVCSMTVAAPLVAGASPEVAVATPEIAVATPVVAIAAPVLDVVSPFSAVVAPVAAVAAPVTAAAAPARGVANPSGTAAVAAPFKTAAAPPAAAAAAVAPQMAVATPPVTAPVAAARPVAVAAELIALPGAAVLAPPAGVDAALAPPADIAAAVVAVPALLRRAGSEASASESSGGNSCNTEAAGGQGGIMQAGVSTRTRSCEDVDRAGAGGRGRQGHLAAGAGGSAVVAAAAAPGAPPMHDPVVSCD